jgi:NAD(P)-dependent dehydrogenase (short-subunit alcohol dehydrogenase family)
MKLKDRVAIITGGGTGIGRAISFAFAREGAKVAVAARNLPRLEETVKAIRAKGGRAIAIQTDITDHEQIKKMVARTIDEFKQIDILVNNAARGTFNNADVPDMNLDEWYDSMNTNLSGVMLCSREVLKFMIPRKSGNIINVSSVAGISGVPKESPYAASKWGLIGLTESLAIEVGKHNIRVNCISPGATRTQEFEDWVKTSAKSFGISYEQVMEKLTENNALGRIAETEEIANCIVFLASDDSSAMTGHNLVASCGFHITHPNMISWV